ncbi:hypothetical protein GOV13_01150 [Candidatus Pacearchaeota archaeon]|nr:hypothetical protein [Candidatus Pacearchaeota archaeon]
MKKTIKINFRDFWPDFDPKKNFFIDLLKNHYNIKISDKPDYVFFSVFGESFYGQSKKSSALKNISPRVFSTLKNSKLWGKLKNSEYWKKRLARQIIPPKGDFIKIFYTSENVKPDMNKCDWAFSFCYDEEFKHPRHLRLPYYFYLGYSENLIKKNISMKKILREKTKFCNFIYSNDLNSRNEFFKILNKYKRVDSPGRCMNNMPPIGDHKDSSESRSSLNWPKEKIRFLKNYKFTIAFESFTSPGYTTEKLVQPMVVNSIPIYYGNPLVNRDFNKKSFLDLNDFKNTKELIERIIEIDGDEKEYAKILKEPWLKGNKINKDMDEKKILKRFKEIFGE